MSSNLSKYQSQILFFLLHCCFHKICLFAFQNRITWIWGWNSTLSASVFWKLMSQAHTSTLAFMWSRALCMLGKVYNNWTTFHILNFISMHWFLSILTVYLLFTVFIGIIRTNSKALCIMMSSRLFFQHAKIILHLIVSIMHNILI